MGIICKVCGQRAPGRDTRFGSDDLPVCSKCAFWLDLIRRKGDHTAVIDGTHYSVFPAADPKKGLLGFGGRKFTVKFKDGRTVVTNNMWHQGEVPALFRKHLPDNAEFVK